MLLPFQTGLYHDQRNYTSLTKTKPPPLSSTSTYQPRVGSPESAVKLDQAEFAYSYRLCILLDSYILYITVKQKTVHQSRVRHMLVVSNLVMA